ncbi:MAG: FtsK/SpoIIIE domain-containing protein [Acidimicrobiia bacterium]
MIAPVRVFLPGQLPITVSIDTDHITTTGALRDALAAAAGYRAEGCVVVDAHTGAPITAHDVLAGADLALVRGEHMVTEVRPNSHREIHQQPRVGLYTPSGCTLPAPPERPPHARLALTAALVPIVGGVVMYALTRNPLTLTMSALSPIALFGSWWSERRRGRKAWRPAKREYQVEIEHAVLQCGEQVTRWEASYAQRYPAPNVLLDRLTETPPQCWDRRRRDNDVGAVRVGVPEHVARVPFTISTGGASELRAHATAALSAAQIAPHISVTVPTRGTTIGIVGTQRHAVATWMACALAVTHSPRDLRIAVAAPTDSQHHWEFAAWLPHASTQGYLPQLDTHLIARGPERAAALLDGIATLITERTSVRSSTFAVNARDDNHVALVCFATDACDRATIAQLAERGAAHAVNIVALAGTRDALPHACVTIIDTDACTVASAEGHTERIAHFDTIDPSTAAAIARILASMMDASVSDDDAHLPNTVRLSDCLGDLSADQIRAHWSNTRAPLTAPIGRTSAGMCTIDLRAHGPHALVAGTTGSGKSALLQTMVSAYAAMHSPDRLQFLLIDYKGGAAFGPCAALPHVAGLVTDLDPGLAQRVLVALDAELRTREAILRGAGVPDLAALEAQRPNAGDIPANLCIIIDEFAALVHEIPEFIDGIVDLAQRGRSLGMHVVLATQHPGGVVNDRIRANTGLRIALRTTSAHDSTDIIGNDSAVHLPRTVPGRAVVAFSSHEHCAVQTAWAAAPVDNAFIAAPVRAFDTGIDITVGNVRGAALPGITAFEATGAAARDHRTDLDDLVAAVCDAHRDWPGRPVVAPWPEPLPEVLSLASLENEPGSDTLTIGLRDEPERQQQPPLTVRLNDLDALLVTGGPGASTTLATIALAAARTHSADACNVHIIDDGTGALRPLVALPHTGTIVSLHEPDATTQVLEWLAATMSERRQLLLVHGAADWQALQELVPDAPPRLVILLDGLHALLHTYERIDTGRWVDLLVRLIADGRSCGVHWCMSSDRVAALPPAIRAHITVRIALGRGDDDDRPMTTDRNRRGRPLSAVRPGRGRIGTTEVQIATAGQHIEALAADVLAVQHATPVPTKTVVVPFAFPDRVVLPESQSACTNDLATWIPTIGLTETGAVAEVDLRHDSLLICGPRKSGRTALLHTLAHSVPLDAVVLIDARALTPDSIEAQLRACLAAARETPELARLIAIDNADLITDGTPAQALTELLAAAQRSAVRIVAVTDMFAVARGYGGWIGELRRTRRAVLLAPMPATDGDAFGVRLRARPGQVFPPGRGYIVDHGESVVVQCVAPTDG